MTSARRRRALGGAAAMLGSLLLPAGGRTAPIAATPRFTLGRDDFLLDGAPLQIRCGEMHFARVPREYWRHRLKALKAMGLNAVCAYLFWNFHEWEEGRYDWDGQRDAAAFCRLAQAEGLWVILRPGPYACAEWEMGGLPWWLLKHPGEAFLRTRAGHFMQPAQRWLAEVGKRLAPLQVSQGGPILMVQVENEYGFFGDDPDYLRAMRAAVLAAGFEVPLFQCNPTSAVAKAHIPELFSVANFGTDPQGAFRVLAQVQQGPRMCGEYYSGWFDTWGAPHRKGDLRKAVADVQAMLAANGSFSLYMAHGGTSFGLWGGCDRPFRPDTSSYDYDAPIGESGAVGDKFLAYREAIRPYLRAGETLPPPPAAQAVITIPRFALQESAAVLDNLPAAAVRDAAPRPIEQYGISRGLIAYQTVLPPGPAGVLKAARVRDLGWVLLDGREAGTFDTRVRRFELGIPARSAPCALTILVYTIARVNFGIEVHDRKGLHGPVTFIPAAGPARELQGWDIRAMDFGADGVLPPLQWKRGRAGGAAFWRASFDLGATGDTFLDMSEWGLGVVWINGRCLGRYWSIGPTQTMYLPGPWLRCGRNDIVVLDLTGPRAARISGLAAPVLDRLQPERDLARPPGQVRLRLEQASFIHDGAFAAGGALQEIRFGHAASGSQLCFEALDSHDGRPDAAIAELALLGEDGQRLSQALWTVAYASSEEREREDGSALNAINGQASDYWLSAQAGPAGPANYPHRIVLDLGQPQRIGGLVYTPRQGDRSTPGRIRRYRLYIGAGLAG